MATVIVGLDIGSDAVKAAVLRGSGKRFELVGFHHRRIVASPVDSSSVPIERPDQEGEEPSDGSLEREQNQAAISEAAAAAVRDVLAAIDEPRAAVIVGVPTQRVSTWRVELPFTDERTIQRLLPGEMATQAPFDIDEMVLDGRIVEASDESSVVSASLVPKSEVRGALSGLVTLDLDPRHLRIDAPALALLARYLPEDDLNASTVLIDIGKQRTLICVEEGGHPQLVRAIDRGGDDLTTALMEANQLSMDQAEEQKRLGISMNGHSGRALAPALEPLLAVIRTTLLGYEASGSHNVRRIFLCGGSSRVEGLIEWMQEQLGVPVAYVSQVHSLGSSAPAVPPEHAQALALGLSGTPAHLEDSIELRKGEFAYRRDTRRLQGAALLVVGLLLLGAFGSIGSFFVTRARMASESKAMEEKIRTTVKEAFPDVAESAIASRSSAVAIMLERVAEVSDVQASGVGFGPRSPLVILKDLSNQIPADVKVDFDELTVNQDGVRITCTTADFESADQVVAILQKAPQFKGAKKGDQSRSRDGSARFTISMPLPGMEAKQ